MGDLMENGVTEYGLFELPPVPGSNLMWRLSARTLRPILLVITRPDWRGTRQTPAEGGAIIALNHISQIDPILATHFMWEHQGRVPSFLAKESLFVNKYVGWWFRGTDHVRVDRSAGFLSIRPAVEALRAGKVLLAYVEGTITRDPEGWPMAPRTGAARMALETRVPVIPVAQWGAQDLMPAYSGRLRLRARPRVSFSVGPAVFLSDLHGLQENPDAVAEASDRIMAAIVRLLEDIREEKAPASDPATLADQIA